MIATTSFPILSVLADKLIKAKTLAGARIGWHCHLTELTALAVETAVAAGAEVYLSQCNPETTSKEAVACMQAMGAKVYLDNDSCSKVIEKNPQVVSDTGLELISTYLKSKSPLPFGACEITTSGITRLRKLESVPLPVVNINNGRLKSAIENFHGVGDGLIDALPQLSDKNWTGRIASVIGYGQVGAGCAHYLKKIGASVEVVDSCPIKQLLAHYDGFALSTIESALAKSELVVCATGQASLLGRQHWAYARDGILIVNVGHFAKEIDLDSLHQTASSHQVISHCLEEFVIAGSKAKVFLACGGHPANVVLLTGSPEPTLIHLTTEILCLEYLLVANNNRKLLPPGEMPIPTEVEQASSLIALEALGLSCKK